MTVNRPASEFVQDISLDLSDDTMITGVVLLAKTVHMDSGDVGLYLATSDGVSWLEKLGMLRAAERIVSGVTRDDD
jgi:hypothetical protein